MSGTGYVTVNSGTVRVRADVNQKLLVPSGTVLYTDAGYLNGEIENNGNLHLNLWRATSAVNQLKNPIHGTGITNIYNSLNNNWENSQTGAIGVDINQAIKVRNADITFILIRLLPHTNNHR